MAKRAKDLTVPLVDSAAELQELLREGFDRGQSPHGDRWAPLKPSTVARKKQNKSDPLVHSGKLRRTVEARGGAKTLRFGIRPGSPASKYGLVHQFSKRKSLPRRPFLPLTRTGEPDFSRGPAASFHQRMLARIRAWILRGERL